jgi:hypothetical protein
MRLPSIITPLAAAFVALNSNAAVITPLLTTDSGSTTSTSTTIGGSRTIDAALNGVGLSGGGTSGDILTETHATAQGNTNNHYLSNNYSPAANVANEVITLDLGGPFNINDIYLWGYSRAESNRGIRTFDIAFDTGSGFGSAVTALSLGITDFDEGPGSGSSSVQTRTFTSTQSGVERVQLSNITNFGGDRIAISEIRFGGTAVPEPSAFLLSSLGTLILFRRRRN